MLQCDDFNGRIEFKYQEGSKNLYNNHICEITLKSVTLEDQGIWKCNLESYHNGHYRGYGWQIQGQMSLEVQPNITMTTTMTTTTTMIEETDADDIDTNVGANQSQNIGNEGENDEEELSDGNGSSIPQPCTL